MRAILIRPNEENQVVDVTGESDIHDLIGHAPSVVHMADGICIFGSNADNSESPVSAVVNIVKGLVTVELRGNLVAIGTDGVHYKDVPEQVYELLKQFKGDV